MVPRPVLRFASAVGGPINGALYGAGECARFGVAALGAAAVGLFKRRVYPRFELIRQLERTGTRSLPIMVLVSTLVGMTLVAQTFPTLANIGQQSFIAGIVGVSVTRTLGPVLAAIVFTGRVGAAFTAEIGTMKVGEEIMALETMGISPVGYLIAPRVAAGVLTLMGLTAVFDLCALVSAYLISTMQYGISAADYNDITRQYVDYADFFWGIGKAAIFSVLISVIACYKGFKVEGGGSDVGTATMKAVVICLVAVIFTDFLLSLLYNVFIDMGVIVPVFGE